LTQRNVANRDIASVAREIAALQAIRRRQDLPPLLVATDQEGGPVSRLSPPLEQQPPLAHVVRAAKTTDERRAAVTDYARRQGQGLAALGVNLNFAPVVDLDFGINNPNDAYTHISTRAISADPDLVGDVADWYCTGLAAQGVRCTLKHFPGLGRVFDDTHLGDATLNTPVEELERADWIPFRNVLGHASHVVMAGHVRLQAVDSDEPASISPQAIGSLLRGTWGYDGVVITDDLCMGAIVYRGGGIERASVNALNAGVDILLISWDGEQIYPALAALLQARESLNTDLLRRSGERLRTLQGALPATSAAR